MRSRSRLNAYTSTGGRPPAVVMAIFLLIGLGMLGGAIYLYFDVRHAIAVAAVADGRVIAIEESRDSDGDYTYYPRVRFHAGTGQQIEFTGDVGSNPSGFAVGEAVRVCYDPSNPDDARIDTFMQLWFMPLLLGGIGTLFSLMGGGIVISAMARRPAASQPTPPAAASPTGDRRSRN